MKRLLPFALFGVLAGCGPVRTTTFILDAEIQVQAARTAGAEKLAPYDYTKAQLYLHKAREEVGYSAYEVAMKFAEEASRSANQARENALAAAREDQPSNNTVTPVP